MAVDRPHVQRWLDDYVAAWKSYDPKAIADLFSADVQYKYAPYGAPVVGREAVVENWLRNPDSLGTYDAALHPVAIDGDTVVAEGRTRYFTDAEQTAIAREFDNLWVLRFDADGRCAEFCEWYMAVPAT